MTLLKRTSATWIPAALALAVAFSFGLVSAHLVPLESVVWSIEQLFASADTAEASPFSGIPNEAIVGLVMSIGAVTLFVLLMKFGDSDDSGTAVQTAPIRPASRMMQSEATVDPSVQQRMVEEVNAEADFPLILGGDHTAMMGHVLGHSLRHERGIGLAVLASAHTGLLRPGTPVYGDKAKLRSDAQATATGDAHRMAMSAALRRIPESFALGEAMKKSAVKADRTSVVGVRAPSTAQIRAAEQASGIDVWSMERLEFDGEQPYRSMLTRSLAAGPIALSIDVGGLDPDLMAAVSDPIPDGLDWSFLKRSLEQAVPHIDRVLGLDICELDPHRDIAQSRGMTRFIEAIAPFLRKISR